MGCRLSIFRQNPVFATYNYYKYATYVYAT